MIHPYNNFVTVLAVVALLFGFMQCFFGWRIFKIALLITGFLVGFVIGGLLGVAMDGGQSGMMLVAIVGGLIGSVLGKTVGSNLTIENSG